jgi:uncharacterized protein (TIGR00725 family)
MAGRDSAVVVFGASWATPGSALYTMGEELGAALVRAGARRVITGGYGGTMEAVSKGAAAAAAAAGVAVDVVGVLVPALFRARDPAGNAFLTAAVAADTLLGRIDTLIASGGAFIALPGTLGTLLEVVAVWNTATLAHLGGYPAPPLILYDSPWRAVVDAVGAPPAADGASGGGLGLPAEHMAALKFVAGAEEAAAAAVAAARATYGVGCGGGSGGEEGSGAGAVPAAPGGGRS